jgi:DedD protein
VPELSHDTAEDGFHEIQLSGKQLVFLFIVTTSVVVGVFLFGVLVGRGAREPRSEEPTPSTSAAPSTSAPVDTSDPRIAEPPPIPAESDKAADSEKPDALSYPDRLTGDKPARESLKGSSEEPRPGPAVVAPPKETVPVPSRTAPVDVPTAGRAGTWLVQVIATRDQAVATSVVKKLTSKGYPAFLINPVAGAPQPFYKVQVGRYNDRSEAEQVSQRIKKEEQFQSWILR